ncbi:MAG: ribulose-phosphate 3-epimerase [Chloroflexi bacterium]|nr:ribulose-phosphate 3-epimerase [Chloroflexota bacterium]OQB00951.1 MAG: Ribulose-phosphate 3-epimerase [Chloroflexi bacterium ADurb.Bin222]HOC21847.1 ribulose-phosphate 3-epimerase [Anaerolineae bacterium]HOS79325.1 ribulose-phosphate 3-epimerase [Anaerolineae bacterium]HQE98474.1 ribulose-phosphate 3-epimerase [Anaerolineae bacterium]
MERRIHIAPSVLAADFSRLGEQVQAAEAAGAEMIHVDVMDGHFVPNISVGVPVVAALRRVTRLPLDVHLMIAEPVRYVEDFARAGADLLTVHPEADVHLHRTLQHIRALGIRAGVALNPGTSEMALRYVLPLTDLVLVMTVNPGFGGQAFLSEMVAKVRAVRQMLNVAGSAALLSVDGGITPLTAPLVITGGADTLVAGSAIFGAPEGIPSAMAALRSAAVSVL